MIDPLVLLTYYIVLCNIWTWSKMPHCNIWTPISQTNSHSDSSSLLILKQVQTRPLTTYKLRQTSTLNPFKTHKIRTPLNSSNNHLHTQEKTYNNFLKTSWNSHIGISANTSVCQLLGHTQTPNSTVQTHQNEKEREGKEKRWVYLENLAKKTTTIFIFKVKKRQLIVIIN